MVGSISFYAKELFLGDRTCLSMPKPDDTVPSAGQNNERIEMPFGLWTRTSSHI